MDRAIQLAARGQGSVEPNPMVGCVIADGDEVISEGWHREFGGPHAEREALQAAGNHSRGATMYVSLEPCCHQGQTAACAPAVIEAGIPRVVIAQLDPNPLVDGGGTRQLRSANVQVDIGLLEDEARQLNAPYLKRLRSGRPWIIAKWAMTLDGRIATRTGSSRWISNEKARQVVHHLRGRVDGILVGRGTVELDDPLLTARPAGRRTATRIVADSMASLGCNSQLVRTVAEAPVLVAAGPDASRDRCQQLVADGCEVFLCHQTDHSQRLDQLLDELGRRQMTNVLVEGGGRLLGSLFDADAIDEVHVFISPKLVGGNPSHVALAGQGIALMEEAIALETPVIEQHGENMYVYGRLSNASRRN